MISLEEFLKDNEDWRVVEDYLTIPPDPNEIRTEFPDADNEVCDRCDEGINISGVLTTRGTLYVKFRRSGVGDKFAAMLSCQRAARGMTDDVFFAGIPTLANQFGSQVKLNRLIKNCQAAGFTPGPYDVYQSGLARFENDPQAVVSRAQGRGYIKKLCEERGWACEGGVNVQHRQPERDPLETSLPMAEDVIRSNARRMIQENPDLKTKSRQEIRQMVLEKHGPTK